MLFDSHTHLDDDKFNEDREAVIEKIRQSGVSGLVNIGCNISTCEHSIALSEKYDFIYATVGFHPCDTGDMTEEHIEKLREYANHKKVVAIGEIGLDYHWDNVPRDVQKYWFERQMKLAEELDMPVSIHNRDAHEDTINICKNSRAKGIVHCFSGSKEMAAEFVKLGYYVSFAGPLTYKNNVKSVEAVKAVPMDRLLIETDAFLYIGCNSMHKFIGLNSSIPSKSIFIEEITMRIIHNTTGSFKLQITNLQAAFLKLHADTICIINGLLSIGDVSGNKRTKCSLYRQHNSIFIYFHMTTSYTV